MFKMSLGYFTGKAQGGEMTVLEGEVTGSYEVNYII
jgi:hypothetical protein